jgi:glucose-1-phosphate cytidylyltransferase
VNLGTEHLVKVVILAGGLGTRLSEETGTRPKPMVDVGDKPILWHIMKLYSHYGFDEFVICLGYKGYVIKEYFSNYSLHNSDLTFDMRSGQMEVHSSTAEPWRVTLVDTGAETMTGGRIKRVADHLGSETFMMTYGDGVADVRIDELLAFHRTRGREATVTAVQPSGRFGVMRLRDDAMVEAFEEKPQSEGGWINGGFFVLEPSVLDRIGDDDVMFEHAPLEGLARDGQLAAYRHEGFWQPMDTLRDKRRLEELWAGGSAPWKAW